MTKEEAFKLWCLWNSKKITDGVFKWFFPMTDPMKFRETYWDRGLKEYWWNYRKTRSKAGII